MEDHDRIEQPGVPPDRRILVGVEHAAELVSISRAQLYRLLDTGEISSMKLGRRRLVPVAALHEWVKRLEGESK